MVIMIMTREDVYKCLTNFKDRQNVIYARVSSTCQKKDLTTQLETLRTFCNTNEIEVEKNMQIYVRD